MAHDVVLSLATMWMQLRDPTPEDQLTRILRPQVLAMEPAPVQVHWHGYPGSLGADFVHYLASDAIVTPPEHQVQSPPRSTFAVLASAAQLLSCSLVHSIVSPPIRGCLCRIVLFQWCPTVRMWYLPASFTPHSSQTYYHEKLLLTAGTYLLNDHLLSRPEVLAPPEQEIWNASSGQHLPPPTREGVRLNLPRQLASRGPLRPRKALPLTPLRAAPPMPQPSDSTSAA